MAEADRTVALLMLLTCREKESRLLEASTTSFMYFELQIPFSSSPSDDIYDMVARVEYWLS